MADPSRPKRVSPVVAYVATIFLSATLLFAIQPIVAKLALPRLGGAPTVWTVAMLFFQAVLLAGYVYAHLLTRHIAATRQPWVHGIVLLAGAAFLPIALPAGWDFNPDAPITWQVLVLFAIAVGVPFFALSANAPLLQRWYATTGGKDASDPYFLYAASNIGSVAALLGYPLLVEPMIGVRTTSWIWAAGYGALIIGVIACANWVRTAPASVATGAAVEPIDPRRFLIWIALAAVPSSMMLSTTQIIATDIGSFPLLWVIPLALYLFSFVIAFSSRIKIPDSALTLVFLVAIIFAILMLAQNRLPNLGWGGFILMLTSFLAVALMFHIRLYQDRPAATSLTAFYLAMSIGGVLGGVFNALIAPLVFNDLLEAHIVLAVVGLALRGAWAPARDIGYGLILLALIVGADYGAKALDLPDEAAFFGVSIVTLMAMLMSRSQPLRFCVIAAGLLVAGYLTAHDGTQHRSRSFFGIYRVHDSQDGKIRSLTHGTTVHGTQYLKDLGRAPEVLSYYHRDGPMAQVIRAAKADARIGIVGLGVGALTCFAQTGQSWTLYEIDGLVDDIARDPELFSYMENCGQDMQTVLGDARVKLKVSSDTYDVLLIDAFSSDAIPLHLVTVEAAQIYRSRVTEDGVILFHISNRFFNLQPVLARVAKAAGLNAFVQVHGNTPDRKLAEGANPSVVVAMSATDQAISALWQRLVADDAAPWTDDHASLLSALGPGGLH